MEAIGIDRSSNWEDTVDRVCRLIGGDPEREKAAAWVEAQGGLDEVKHNYSFMTEQVAERVGVERKPDEPAHFTIGRIIGELDKRLMPEGMEWPRFEDGAKVCFGDEYENSNGNVSVASRFGFKADEYLINRGTANGWEAYGKLVKRPKPAALAADGLPIEVGETVYGGDGEAWEVIGIENGPWSIVGTNGEKQREMKPKWLTHEVPTIYGNDGLPLLPGQKAITGAGFCMTVESVHYDKSPRGCIEKWVRYKNGSWDLAESVSHAKPKDTQERIDDDSRLNPIPYARDVLHRGNWDKLTERQAFRLMIDDLMRRKHELDARTMGGAE